jgi:cytochrome b involved in lipid metabolism
MICLIIQTICFNIVILLPLKIWAITIFLLFGCKMTPLTLWVIRRRITISPQPSWWSGSFAWSCRKRRIWAVWGCRAPIRCQKKKMKEYCIGLLKKEKEEEKEGVSKRNKQRYVPESELVLHAKEGDAWIAIHGKVYDVSKFDHPGGKQILLNHWGRDSSIEFVDIQHQMAEEVMKDMCIGDYGGLTFTSHTLKEEKPHEDSHMFLYLLIGLAIVLLYYFS